MPLPLRGWRAKRSMAINIPSLTGLAARMRKPAAITTMIALSLLAQLTTAAQTAKLPQATAQETKPAATAATPAVPRVGVDESPPLTLALFDVVKLALQNNREMEVERLNVQQAEYD